MGSNASWLEVLQRAATAETPGTGQQISFADGKPQGGDGGAVPKNEGSDGSGGAKASRSSRGVEGIARTRRGSDTGEPRISPAHFREKGDI